jgi:hypothetical protein
MENYRLRNELETNLSERCGFLPERSRPQFQHSENWPSIVSPQPGHSQDFFTDSNGANVFLRIDFALVTFSSSITQSSGQQSMGGSSPAALLRSRLRAMHRIPNVAKTFFKWPIISGSLALWIRFMLRFAARLFAAPQRSFIQF